VETHLLTPWQQFGLIGLLAGTMSLILFFIIKWTLATTKEILSQSAKERECWQSNIKEINKSMDAHTAQAKQFHEQVNEAHKFQREEHKEMIGQLREITVTLGRINGYKNEHK
jgi:septal ring factor EnvC (AmiA/AmiB activator)